jgi:probable rRNA maturation factor
LPFRREKLSTLSVFMLSISVNNQQSLLKVDKRLLKKAVRLILKDAEIHSGEISIAVVDDEAIARIHAEFLEDDSPTDCISFVLESSPGCLEGEVVASAETAIARAAEFQWPPETELLLYVVHGILHLVGYDDTTSKTRAVMRKMEKQYLQRCTNASRTE